MGDGDLVYFGYPQAHEDDAERAVRARLGLVAEVAALKTPVSLQSRVGIATGGPLRSCYYPFWTSRTEVYHTRHIL
jgi:class 3 adenylate cyclase